LVGTLEGRGDTHAVPFTMNGEGSWLEVTDEGSRLEVKPTKLYFCAKPCVFSVLVHVKRIGDPSTAIEWKLGGDWFW